MESPSEEDSEEVIIPSQEILRSQIMNPIQSKVKKKLLKKYTSHKCSICSKQFPTKHSLDAHKKTHNDTRSFSCHLCPHTTTVAKYLQRHIRIKHEAGNLECKVCKKRFHFQNKLTSHMWVHTGERPYKCDVCGKCFNALYSLKTHTLIHTGKKPYTCSYCPYACRDSSTLRKHEARHRGQVKTYPCGQCDKIFKLSVTLKLHVAEVHLCQDTRKHECPVCHRKFKQSCVLARHVSAVHERSRTYTCEICSRTLSERANLRAHLRTHLCERPHACSQPGCGNTFKDKSTLTKHMLTHARVRCSFCARSFARAPRLREHERMCADGGGAVCHHCGARYSNKACLSVHIRAKHERRITYHCDTCGASVDSKAKLYRHVRRKHFLYDKPRCHKCRKEYRSLATLKAHYMKKHKIIEKSVKKEIDTGSVDIKEEPETEEEVDVPIDLFEIHKHECDDDNLKETLDSMFEQASMQLSNEKQLEINNDDNNDLNDDSKEIDLKDNEICEKSNDKAENTDAVSKIDAKHKDTSSKIDLQEINDNIDEVNTELPKDLDNHLKAKHKDTSSKIDLQEINDNIHEVNTELPKDLDNNLKLKIPVLIIEDIMKSSNRNLKDIVSKAIRNSMGDVRLEQAETVEERRKMLLISMERTRQVYNKRMMEFNSKKEEKMKIKHFNLHKTSNMDKEGKTNEMNNDETEENEEANNITEENEVIQEEFDVNDNIEEHTTDNVNIGKRKRKPNIKYSEDSDSNGKSDKGNTKGKSIKIKFSTEQCYICFKLFNSKQELVKHCQEHFDVCSEISLKKCPFCPYVTKLSITRHLKLVHDVNIKLPYAQIKDRKENVNGSRYYYEINDGGIDNLEIIPSIKNLNKRACNKIDKNNREAKNKVIAKTKLVKKGNEWVIEAENIKLKLEEYVIPEINEDDIKKLKDKECDDYPDRMKNLSRLAKMKGVKMLFPCDKCEKICQTFAALKLHLRLHDPNKKPFKKKVWKHKIKDGDLVNDHNDDNATALNKDNRQAEPKPVVNKHKCDPKLIEFYKANVKGGDIEFWQFLKIFNKMDRDNVNNFEDLQNCSNFDINYYKDKDEKANNSKDINKNKSSSYKRVKNVRKTLKNKRNMIKKKLRENIGNIEA